MPATKVSLAITDQRMLQLMDYCISHNVEGITNKSDWCRLVGLQPTHINNVESGERGFSKVQMQAAGEKLGVSMDFIFGFTKQMFRIDRKRNPLDLLKEAVRAVEAELKAR